MNNNMLIKELLNIVVQLRIDVDALRREVRELKGKKRMSDVSFLLSEIDRIEHKVNRDMSDKWQMISDIVKKLESLEERIKILEGGL